MIKKIKRKIVRNILFIKISFFIQKIKSKKNSEKNYRFHKMEKILAAKTFFNINILIETGTYLGEAINFLKNNFSKIYSIELSTLLANEAMDKFKKHNHVEVINGDSGLALLNILKKETDKKLFWLDAHYSGGITAFSDNFKETPIVKELESIFDNWVNGSIVLIDDARMFDGRNNYPDISFLHDFVLERRSELRIFIDRDIIHIF